MIDRGRHAGLRVGFVLTPGMLATGTALPDTRWFNPQLYRSGGTLTTSKGFDESFRVDGGPLW